jgi:hypothetical protein
MSDEKYSQRESLTFPPKKKSCGACGPSCNLCITCCRRGSARSQTPPRHRGRAPPPSSPEESRGRAARRGRGPRGYVTASRGRSVLTGPYSPVTKFIPALRTVQFVFMSCTRFQLVIGCDCMRRAKVDNSRCELC